MPTFKPLKRGCRQDGYNPSTCPDGLYVNDPECGAYVALDQQLYQRIQAGSMPL
jgi:hypothetical protein